jgi:NitT/TauT family transport system permease protein
MTESFMHPETVMPHNGADAGLSWRLPREAIVSIVVCAIAWQLLSMASPAIGLPPFAVPSLARIWDSLLKVSPIDAVVTLARVVAALVISFALGIAGAVVMYLSPTLDRYARPVVRVLMAVPVVSWILFAILWFKWVEFRIAFVLVVVCGPVFLVDALHNMRSVSNELRKMVKSFRPTLFQFFVKLIVPATLPGILTSWKINLSLAIRVVTIAELVGAVTGIGHRLAVAQELFSVADVFAWTLVLVALLFALEALLARVETRFLRWRT